MSVIAIKSPSKLSSFFDGAGKAIGAFFIHLIENSGRARAAEARRLQIELLDAKTDAELAAMHLRRDDIASYVFRDMLYI